MPQRPKLGQHFLVSASVRERLAQALPILRDDLVIEIGPGKGAMTELLARRSARLVAIELDAALAGALALKLAPNPAIEVLQADVLTADLAEICRTRSAQACFVFGNLPYYITSPILHHLFEYRTCIRGMALLMQREVAQRVTAAPGRRDYGYLSVIAQLFSQPRLLFTVPPGAFAPPPQVQSALVEFRMAPRFPTWSREQAAKFLEFVQYAFAHKRKSVANNLLPRSSRSRVEDALRHLGLTPKVRAEEMTLEQLAALQAALKIDSSDPR